jgi:hypothetical protein
MFLAVVCANETEFATSELLEESPRMPIRGKKANARINSAVIISKSVRPLRANGIFFPWLFICNNILN